MQKRTVLIFSIFVSYIIFQFLWWEVLLVKQSNEIIKEKQNLVALSTTNFDTILKDIEEGKIKIKEISTKIPTQWDSIRLAQREAQRRLITQQIERLQLQNL